ncbi:hypothetical protein BDB00DRAFT_942147 [Zychaea mexicana]|uniref:uncharacterized protein n=1 Tax=Zychaea mexicana TaxID=64656 RepID=UPI0022FE2B5E|nr:uncharacterized protein BDB00DRAFT_942147 [Zychaea mexicana]KAI9488626.1 hypothetical protein BDB00DRAFT_942147 [Zychaea mexicana]
MYITYEVEQSCHVSPFFGSFQYCEKPDLKKSQTLSTPPKSDFMPTWLVRVSDMSVVRGSTVTDEGYCTVSYSWSWSGNMILDKKNSKAERDDQGKHKIIYPAMTVRQDEPTGREGIHIPGHTKYVKFEAVVQQVCMDFGVKYVWFDQMCINQGNKEEKLREIRQMHRIYSNAYCTVVLIPELHTKSAKEIHEMGLNDNLYIADLEEFYTSEWVKRLWTFEEALLSPKMLFVGRNMHMWSSTVPENDSFLNLLCQEKKRLPPSQQQQRGYNVSTVLYHAHLRTSTKEHDRAFALANLFPHIMDGISVSYDQPVLDLMVEFYGHLAMMDLSILCFNKCTDSYKERGIENMSQISCDTTVEEHHDIPIKQHDLPSWTGINGEHLRIDLGPDAPADHLQTTFSNYNITGRFMNITCMGLTSINDNKSDTHSDEFTLCHDDLLTMPDSRDYSVNKVITQNFELAISVRLPGQSEDRIVGLRVTFTSNEANIIKQGSEYLRLLSHFVPINKKKLLWHPIRSASKTYRREALSCDQKRSG